MKTEPGILTHSLVLCITFGTMALFGQSQVTYVWTNQFPGHLADVGDMNQATNWSPNGVPNPMSWPDPPYSSLDCGDSILFDGRTTGPLSVTESGGTLRGSGSESMFLYGVRIHLTSNQTNSVMIYSVLPVSDGMRMNYFDCEPGSGGLILGDHDTNILDIIAGSINGQVLGFTNNSATPCEINASVRWRLGGSGTHPFVFAGTGDWIVNNHMRSAYLAWVLIQKLGPGTMIWSGTNVGARSANWFYNLGSPITIGGGTLILKSSDLLNADAGGPDIVHNGTLLKFDWTPAPGIITTPDTVPGNISGTGPIQVNAGTVTLSGTNTYTGTTTVINGTLFVNGANTASPTIVSGGALGGVGTLSGPITLSPGATLAPGASSGSIGTLTINSNLFIGGDLAIEVNKLLSSSNDFVVVSGVLTNAGTGTLTVSNLGPALTIGDQFTLFGKPMQNGAAMTVTGAGATWVNNLAVDGSITVASVSRPALNFTLTGGNNLQFSWDASFGNYKLQSQTNGLSVGLTTNWVDYPGGGTSPVTVPIDEMNETVFFRLISAP